MAAEQVIYREFIAQLVIIVKIVLAVLRIYANCAAMSFSSMDLGDHIGLVTVVVFSLAVGKIEMPISKYAKKGLLCLANIVENYSQIMALKNIWRFVAKYGQNHEKLTLKPRDVHKVDTKTTNKYI